MRHPRPPLLLLAAALLGLAQCKKSDPDPPTPESQLPPATQTGAHTFGCLLNGQVWLPDGGSFGPPNFRLVYDPTYAGGNLEIRVYRYPNGQKTNQYFLIGGAPISKVGTYPIDNKIVGVYYDSGTSTSCAIYNNAPGLIEQGQLTITKLDLTHNIISGTFAFKLWQPGCDTVKVTQGRFDKHL